MLYVFKVINKEDKEIYTFFIKGNPYNNPLDTICKVIIDNPPNSKVFSDYCIKKNERKFYKSRGEEVKIDINKGESLFGHMKNIKKREIDTKIYLYGAWRRVQPYNEIKTKMNPIITKYLNK